VAQVGFRDAAAINRFELFDAYVVRRCSGLTSSATARRLFSELALPMSQQFVSSLPAWESRQYLRQNTTRAKCTCDEALLTTIQHTIKRL